MKRSVVRQLVTLLFLCIGQLANLEAQDQPCYSLKGLLIDSETKNSLAGAHLSLNGLPKLSSNHLGLFGIECIPQPLIVLNIQHLGYEDLEYSVDLSEVRDRLVIPLIPVPLEMSEVLVEKSGLLGGQRIESLPGSSYLLSPRDLAKFQSSDVHKMLASVPGVYMQQEDGYGLRPNIGMRGTGVERSSKITVMEDGVMMAPAPYAASAAYYFPSVARMHSSEVRKGSSQIAYGPFTTGGALNFLSTPLPSSRDGILNWMVGSDQAYKVLANYGTSFKNGAFLFETLQLGSDGFKKADYNASTGFAKQDYMAKLRLDLPQIASVSQSIAVKIGITKEDSDETYLGLVQDDFKASPYRRYASSEFDNITSDHRQLQLRHLLDFSKQAKLLTTIYRNDFERDWYKLDHLLIGTGEKVSLSRALTPEYIGFLDGTNDTVDENLMMKHNNRAYVSRGFQSVFSYEPGNSSFVESAELGIRLHRDEMDRFQWVDRYVMRDGRMKVLELGTPGTDSNRIESAKAFSIHGQTVHRLGPLTLSPGLRLESATLSRVVYGKEDVERSGLNISRRANEIMEFLPGLGVTLDLDKSNILFGGIHRGFSPPGSTEGALPESSNNYELGFRRVEQRNHIELVGFYSDYSNLLGSDLAATGGAGTTDLFNGGEASVFGLEALVKQDLGSLVDWKLSLPLEISYTYTVGKFDHSFSSDYDAWGDVEVGDHLPYLPKNVISLTAGLQSEKLDVFANLRYTSRMRFVAGTSELDSSNSTDAPILVTLSSSYQLSKRFNLFAKVENVTNQVYIVSSRPYGLRPGLHRNGSLGITARLN